MPATKASSATDQGTSVNLSRTDARSGRSTRRGSYEEEEEEEEAVKEAIRGWDVVHDPPLVGAHTPPTGANSQRHWKKKNVHHHRNHAKASILSLRKNKEE